MEELRKYLTAASHVWGEQLLKSACFWPMPFFQFLEFGEHAFSASPPCFVRSDHDDDLVSCHVLEET